MKEILRFPIKQVLGNGTKVTVSQKAITEALNSKVNTSLTINGIPLIDDVELNAESVGTYSKEAIDEMLKNMNQTVMVGQGIFLQNNLPNLVEHEGCTYLKSGVTVAANTLPNYPESLKVGTSYPLAQGPSNDYKLSGNINMFVSCDDYVLGFVANSQDYLRFALNEAKDKVEWTVHSRPADLILSYYTRWAPGGMDYYFAGHGSRIVGHSHYTNDGINWIKTTSTGLPPTLSGHTLVPRSVTVSSDGSKWYKCFVYTKTLTVPDQNNPGQDIDIQLGVQTSEGHIVFESSDGINWSRVPQQNLPVLTNKDPWFSDITWAGVTRVVSDGEYICYHSDQAWEWTNSGVGLNVLFLTARSQLAKIGSTTYVDGRWDIMVDVWYQDHTPHSPTTSRYVGSNDKGKTSYSIPAPLGGIFTPSKYGLFATRVPPYTDRWGKYYQSGSIYELDLVSASAPGHTGTRQVEAVGGNKDFMVLSDKSKSFGWNVFGKTHASIEGDWVNIGITAAQQGLYLRIK